MYAAIWALCQRWSSGVTSGVAAPGEPARHHLHVGRVHRVFHDLEPVARIGPFPAWHDPVARPDQAVAPLVRHRQDLHVLGKSRQAFANGVGSSATDATVDLVCAVLQAGPYSVRIVES